MDQADGIIIPILQSIGCGFGNEITSMKQFDNFMFIEGLIKCLHLIDESYHNLSPKLPKGKAKQFKYGTKLSKILKNDLGYRGQVGFDTFLYINEDDVRKILRFVVQKLPERKGKRGRSDSVASRGIYLLTYIDILLLLLILFGMILGDDDESDVEQGDFTSLLDSKIVDSLRKWTKDRYSILREQSNIYEFDSININYPIKNDDNNDNNNNYIEYCNNYMDYVCNQINDDNTFIPSILNHNHINYLIATQQQRMDDDDTEQKGDNILGNEFNIDSINDIIKNEVNKAKNETSNTNQLKNLLKQSSSQLNNTSILDKSNFVLKKEFMTQDQNKTIITRDENDNEIQINANTGVTKNVNETNEETEQRRKQEIEAIKNKIEKLKNRLNKMDFEIERKTNELNAKKKENEELKAESKKLEQEYFQVKKTIELLPNGKDNIRKLQKIVQNTQNKFENLKSKWSQKKNEYISEFEMKKKEIEDRLSYIKIYMCLWIYIFNMFLIYIYLYIF